MNNIELGDIVRFLDIDPETYALAKEVNAFHVIYIEEDERTVRLLPHRNRHKIVLQHIDNLERMNKFRRGDSVRFKKSIFNQGKKRPTVKVKKVDYNSYSGHTYIETSTGHFPNESDLMLKKRAANNE